LCFVCMDVVALVSGCFIRNKKLGRLKVSKVLSIALEPISKSAVHYLARVYLRSGFLRSPGIGRCNAVDETATYTYGPL